MNVCLIWLIDTVKFPFDFRQKGHDLNNVTFLFPCQALDSEKPFTSAYLNSSIKTPVSFVSGCPMLWMKCSLYNLFRTFTNFLRTMIFWTWFIQPLIRYYCEEKHTFLKWLNMISFKHTYNNYIDLTIRLCRGTWLRNQTQNRKLTKGGKVTRKPVNLFKTQWAPCSGSHSDMKRLKIIPNNDLEPMKRLKFEYIIRFEAHFTSKWNM